MSEKYIFLDRDGVINKDPEGWTEYSYVTRPEDFYFLPNVLDAFKETAKAGYSTVILSNQQGIGKGYFTKEALDGVTARMLADIKKAGGKVAGVYYCIHKKDEGCDCHKPLPGLFYKAQKELGIKELKDKFYIGDTHRDIEAGKRAGLKTILVLSGKSFREDAKEWEYKPDQICNDLLEAVRFVIREGI